MSNQIYSKKNYVVVSIGKSFIVINTRKQFAKGHTHISSYSTCVRLIDWSINKKLPKRGSRYILISLIRLARDERYIEKLNSLLPK
jgi:hypothetical protein